MDDGSTRYGEAAAFIEADSLRSQQQHEQQEQQPAARADDDAWADDGPIDPDTCRICRGESTAEEPLFYPCKCSGSIKYVHQNCLMEWLSHSQKKHCELCKTPFRFTKLYAPDMPKRLPFNIFIHHMARYLFRNFLVWLRAVLVASVWLGWLPFLMRSVWSFLFWISDEGLGSPSVYTSMQSSSTASLSVTGTTTCPSTPLLPATTTAASIGSVIYQVPVTTLLKAMSKPLNLSSTHTWLRMLFGMPVTTPTSQEDVFPGNLNVTLIQKTGRTPSFNPRQSLLSEVGFLNRITRNSSVNRTIIKVLEGQVITLLAIVCFILIILVRDYVVQQQPEINMRAAFAAEDAENDMVPAAAPAPLANDPVPEPAPNSDPEENSDVEDEQGGQIIDDHSSTSTHNEHRGLRPTEPLPDLGRGPNLRARPIVGMRRRPVLLNIPDQGQTSRASSVASERSPLNERLLEEGGFLREPSPLGIDREEPSARTTIGEYVRIYRAAEGDNVRIREIIRQEGLEESRFSRFLPSSPTSSVVAEKACSDSSSWTWAGSDDGENDDLNNTRRDKGKAKAENVDADDEEEQPSPSSPPPSIVRPRAVSDGPPVKTTFNALANHSWTFDNLSPAPVSAEDAETTVYSNHEAAEAASVASSSNAPIIRLPDSQSSDHSQPSSFDPSVADGPVNMVEQVRDGGNQSYLVWAAGETIRLEAVGPEAVMPVVAQPRHITDRIADFMWGDVHTADDDDVNQEEAVDIFGDNQNPPFMHGGHGGGNNEVGGRDGADMVADVVDAALAAGLDPNIPFDGGAVEDAEDFDGIMELIGMHGPMIGLFQNAVFCAFLVAISICIGIFLPYNIGRVAAWILANPVRLFRMLFSMAGMVQDTALLALGYTCTFVSNLLEACRLVLRTSQGKEILRASRLSARQLSARAWDRIGESLMFERPILSTSEMRNFSAVSHQALLVLKGNMRYSALAFGNAVVYIFGGDYMAKWLAAQEFLTHSVAAFLIFLRDLPKAGLRPSTWMINLSSPEPSLPFNMGLAYWDAHDRGWAILLGYASITLIAALYLARGTPFSTSQAAQEWEASFIDALTQASGVMKVILIISIEMLVFPLYCGILLDIALLPLIENTTLKSRLLFAYHYPFTSIFVHWFIGTGYMFHFALFVSMCRKIMRKGVLYFIRDPDDPEFHPVRDVLERNVTTQLRKIMFSAFVYGALVVICLGGVVWGLTLTIPNVLPIHYTYNEPVLEFPVDLLFCNFLMPLAVKFFKPSDGLHTMYTWWFRRCASALRLTWFLFGERRLEEEGKLGVVEDFNTYRSWRSMFLTVNGENEVVLQRWDDYFGEGELEPGSKMTSEEMVAMNEQKRLLVESGQLVPDGQFVLSPASDQAKIPKGRPVFIHVSEQDIIEYHEIDPPETGLLSGDHYQLVYIPPWFRTRIFIFILSIWIFAAVTGVSSTIVPLVVGRRLFKALVPPNIRTNDIYAFSIGVYVLSSASYLVFHLHSALEKVREWATSILDSIRDRHALQRVVRMAYRTLRLTYVYTMLLLVFPILITVLVETYVLIPLDGYMYSANTVGTGDARRHTVRVIQAWTLGILYLKLGSRALTMYGGLPADAVRAVLRRGWLDPNVRVLTKGFVLPFFAASAIMLLVPPMIAWAALRWFSDYTTGFTYAQQVSVYRLCYPAWAMAWVLLYMLRRVFGIFEGWHVRIRDEAYLMGERLHNFTGTATTKASAWRGGTRI